MAVVSSFPFSCRRSKGSIQRPGMLQSAIGIAAGAGVIYAVVRGGKLLFGRQKVNCRRTPKLFFPKPAFACRTKKFPTKKFFIASQTPSSCTRALWKWWIAVMPTPPCASRRRSCGLMTKTSRPKPCRIWRLSAPKSSCHARRWGFGDVKFMAAIGAFLGWKAVLFTFMAACMIGAVYGSAMVLMHKQKWSGRLYFGPFLAAAATIWIFDGPALVNWYLNFSQHLLTRLTGHWKSPLKRAGPTTKHTKADTERNCFSFRVVRVFIVKKSINQNQHRRRFMVLTTK